MLNDRDRKNIRCTEISIYLPGFEIPRLYCSYRLNGKSKTFFPVLPESSELLSSIRGFNWIISVYRQRFTCKIIQYRLKSGLLRHIGDWVPSAIISRFIRFHSTKFLTKNHYTRRKMQHVFNNNDLLSTHDVR